MEKGEGKLKKKRGVEGEVNVKVCGIRRNCDIILTLIRFYESVLYKC